MRINPFSTATVSPWDGRILLGYVGFIFLLVSVAVFFSPEAGAAYLSLAILLMGLVAAILQKRAHRGTFGDMGFRLGPNVVVGLLIALAFLAITFTFTLGLPLGLGLIKLTPNPQSASGVPAFVVLPLVGVFLFLNCLFGEELGFRGYILPRLCLHLGPGRAVLLCAALFGLWHVPAYYSIYAGGAAEEGVGSVALMALAHGVSSIPLCLLYLTTRELYSVSLIHTVIDLVEYRVLGDPATGHASQEALYTSEVLNEPAVLALGAGWLLGSSFLMWGLCRLVKGPALPSCPDLRRPPHTEGAEPLASHPDPS